MLEIISLFIILLCFCYTWGKLEKIQEDCDSCCCDCHENNEEHGFISEGLED